MAYPESKRLIYETKFPGLTSAAECLNLRHDGGALVSRPGFKTLPPKDKYATWAHPTAFENPSYVVSDQYSVSKRAGLRRQAPSARRKAKSASISSPARFICSTEKISIL